MKHEPCRWCQDGRRDIPHNSAEMQEMFACHDARFPRFMTLLRGVAAQLDRATR